MKLGGHETFYPRPGWLTKGLLHLHEGHSGTFSTPEIADELGVGRNMAKSIGHISALTSEHWLQVKVRSRGSFPTPTRFRSERSRRTMLGRKPGGSIPRA